MSTGVVQSIVDKQTWLDDVSNAIQPAISEIFANAGEPGKVAKDFLNGVWLGHPLHPVITDVPIGAWTMTQVFDALSILRGGDDALDMASDVTLGAGIVTAVAAAVTGIVDWSDVRKGSRRRIGLAHALLNVGGLTLNLGSLGLRLAGKRNRGAARALSAGGFALSGLAAYVAGELVYNLGMAINRNAWVAGPKKFVDFAAAGDIEDGKMQHFEVGGRDVVVVKHEDGIHAFGGTCSHLGCGLWQGKLDGHVVTCPCHGSEFDITDGSVVHGPATAPVPGYEVRESNGRLQLREVQEAGSEGSGA
ncbi:MAG: Rieske 2Fe-2S domain-containing protein [Chloroflexota bacterium]